MDSRQSDNPLSHKNGIPIDADGFVIRMPLRLLNNRSSSAQYNNIILIMCFPCQKIDLDIIRRVIQHYNIASSI